MFQNIRGVLAQISGVGVLTSVLYLQAYWSTFGVPIFEYANIKDIITGTIILLGSSLVFSFAGMILSELTNPRAIIRELTSQKWKNRSITETKIGQFLWRLKPIYYFLLLVFWFSSISTINKMFFFPLLLVLGFQAPIEKSGFLSDIENKNIRSVLICFFIFAIGFSYFFGKSRAEYILNDEPSTLYEVGSKRKYLGYTNGYFFFLSPDNSKIIMNRASSRDSLLLISAANKTAKKDSD